MAEQRWSLAQLRGTLSYIGHVRVGQRTREWHAARSYRLTASDAPRVCGNLTHMSSQKQQEEVVFRKVAAAQALNRGDPLPEGGRNQQQARAMAWGREHEADGVVQYLYALATRQLQPELLARKEGVEIVMGTAESPLQLDPQQVLGYPRPRWTIQECGMQVRY